MYSPTFIPPDVSVGAGPLCFVKRGNRLIFNALYYLSFASACSLYTSYLLLEKVIGSELILHHPDSLQDF
jgi:hypothetical protein